jgi:prephenate dehydrogenase
MKVCIIGLGLIGGSMAIDLKKRKFTDYIVGVDNSSLHAHTALRLGIIDEIADLKTAVKKTDFIILAIPANASMKILPEILDLIDNQVGYGCRFYKRAHLQNC